MEKLKIVVLDGYTLNPGDNTWDKVESLGSLTVYDRTLEKDIVSRSKDADILLTNKTPVTKETIDACKNLKYIGTLATGFNVVDIEYARKKNIPVCNIPVYGTKSVAQFVFALTLELCHHIGEHSREVHEGKWNNQPDFSYWSYPLIELEGKTMGIIGFGRIGRSVGDLANALGMKVLAYDTNMSNPPSYNNFDWSSLEDLFKQSDVISLNCLLTDKTLGIVNKEKLALMKKTAFIVNASRGPLINENDLAYALNNDIIAGAALDVLSSEPPKLDNPLLKAKNCILTPHIAWASLEARQRLMQTTYDNIVCFINGKVQNVVN